MKELFPGYYRPTPADFEALWRSAAFVPDANVFLSIYGYSPRTRLVLLDVFESVAERVWIPHQFASEYVRNRPKAILEQVANYRSVKDDLQAILKNHFLARTKHPFIRKRALRDFQSLCAELSRGEQQHTRLLSEDPYFRRVTELLTGRVGDAYTADALKPMYDEARDRYARRIPPGYQDEKKDEPFRYGDYIGWRQILAHGRDLGVATVFVTDDDKDDWWLYQGTRRLGPRPEIVAEYHDSCHQPFYMYTVEAFMAWAREHLGRRVEPAALQEVRERSEAKQLRHSNLAGAAGEPKESVATEVDATKPPVAPVETGSEAKAEAPEG